MEEKHCKWYNDEFCTNGDSPCVADYCPVVGYPDLCKHREVDEDINVRSKTEEKVLTDEEVAKAILQSIEYSKTITYFDEWGNCKSIMVTDILNLIHRLQNTEKANEEAWEIKEESYKRQIAEQKAEIERLTEWKDTLQDTKDELEQQLIDTGFKEYCEENKRLTEENAELQKQVDELTEKNKNLKYSFDTANGYIKKLAESCETNCEKFNGITTQQTAKDTAKEILTTGKNYKRNHSIHMAFDLFISWIKERYGVEVE